MVYRHVRRKGDKTSPHPTRERLIDTAVEVIGEVGLDHFDINEVLRRAEVTSGALYHHFRDIPELLEQAMARRFPIGVHESIAMMRDAIDQATTIADFHANMQRTISASQDVANRARRAERAHYLALAFSNPSLRDLIAAEQREITAGMTDVMLELQRRGWLRPGLDPKAAAVFVQTYTLGRIIDDISDDPMDPAAWNQIIDTVMVKALSSDQPVDAD